MVAVLLEGLIVSCRRMLSVEDRVAIMVGLEAGLSQVRITHSIGRSPSVVCRDIARHRGPGGVYKAQDARRAAQVARRRPKKRLLDHDEVPRHHVIADVSQGARPARSAHRLSMEACGTAALWTILPTPKATRSATRLSTRGPTPTPARR